MIVSSSYQISDMGVAVVQPSAAYSIDATVASKARGITSAREALDRLSALVFEQPAPNAFDRAWTVTTSSEAALREALQILREHLGRSLLTCEDRTLELHRRGTLRLRAARTIGNLQDLEMIYTPGASRIACAIADDPSLADDLTGRPRRVAMVTDGTAVPSLRCPDALAALPIIEGKAAVLAMLTGLEPLPLALAARSLNQFIHAITALAPSVAAIVIDNVAAPRCFLAEAFLHSRLAIPIVFNNQHPTAVAVLAGLTNALAVVKRDLRAVRIVVCGAGAAGTATTHLLTAAGATDIVVVDRHGILDPERRGLLAHHGELARVTNPRGVKGTLADALANADVFIGLSAPAILDPELVCTMAIDPIVFALADPEPEVDPDAIVDVAAIVATGSSQYPNQISNLLTLPGVLRGLLADHRGRFSVPMQLAAAAALVEVTGAVRRPTRIMPSIFDRRVVQTVADAVRRTDDQHVTTQPT